MMNYRILFLFFISACGYQPDKTNSSVNQFDDPRHRLIADWQDRRYTDSLIMATRNMADEYKAAAAMALASVQDSEAIPALTDLLANNNSFVRKAAAYALGQTYDTAAYGNLAIELSGEKDPEVRFTLLEAIGKTIPAPAIGELLNFTPKSGNESAGFAWALYRAGVRGVHSDESTVAAVKILDTTTHTNARLAAAHYLARVNYEELPAESYEVLNKKFKDPEVRMAVASALSNAPTLVSANALKELLQDNDYRVRINAVRSIPNERIFRYKSFVDSLLLDKNVNTAVATAEKIAESAHLIQKEYINEWLEFQTNWRVGALLLQAALLIEPENESRLEQAKKRFEASKNPYERAALLTALQHSFQAHNFIITQMFKASHPAVTTAGMAALSEMRRKKDFPEALKPAFIDVFKQAIESGDPALIDIAAAVLREPSLDFREEIKDYSFLTVAKKKLELPKDNETLQSLEKTLAFFTEEEPTPVINTFNHPIDWQKLSKIKSVQEATIQTSIGNIIIELFTDEAPGTVLNFVSLARRGYYNNKYFHRVVPNFVVQGGGNRGDGWGGEDYSIRSEFADLKYKTGTIGMASAGKDTEGTQWFITHSPTPHLDGRYTIFARVKQGMEVVHKLEQGDKIEKITIN